MARQNDEHEHEEERELAELAQAADGTLDADRLAAFEARAQASPELAAQLERQRFALRALQMVEAGAVAPLSLRERIEAAREGGAERVPWYRRLSLGLGLGIAGAAAAVVLVVLLALPAGSPGGPSVVQAAQLATRPPEDPPPNVDRAVPRQLDIEGAGIPFPNWLRAFDWRPVGSRTDELDGRTATTVFYEKDGKRIGYTIVDGDYIPPPDGARTTRVGDTDFATFDREDGARAVTWERDGKTCIVSGAGVADANLVDLAAW